MNTTTREVVDLIVAVVPPRMVPPALDGLHVLDPEFDVALAALLDRAANESVQNQDRPAGLVSFGRVHHAEWVLSRDIDEVTAYPLPHDCDQCRDGKSKAIARLEADPSSCVALGTLRYMTEWRA